LIFHKMTSRIFLASAYASDEAAVRITATNVFARERDS